MNLKRIEIPLGWHCQINCFFCSEKELLNINKNKSLKFSFFTKLLIDAVKKGYNSLTIVGGEPTIEKNFFKAIKLAKKLGMHIQISTNGLKLIDESFTKELSKYIDRLTLSIQCLEDKTCKEIIGISIQNRKDKINKIIKNLNNYFFNKKNKEARINIVLNKKLPLNELQNIIYKFTNTKFKEIHITYPDIDDAIGTNNIKYLLINKKESIDILNKLELTYKTKLVDFPFCFVPEDKKKYIFINKADIIKIHIKKQEINSYKRPEVLPRKRKKIKICESCKFNKICRGRPIYYINGKQFIV